MSGRRWSVNGRHLRWWMLAASVLAAGGGAGQAVAQLPDPGAGPPIPVVPPIVPAGQPPSSAETPPAGTQAVVGPGATVTVAGDPPPASPPGPAGPPAQISSDTPLPPGTSFETVGPPPPQRRHNVMRPFPVVRIAGRLTARGARIRVLSVRAPAGVTAIAVCRGPRCPRRAQRARVPRQRGRMSGSVRFRALQRSFRAGVRISVFVVKPGFLGKYTRFRVRAGLAPERRDLCVGPRNLRRPRACPPEATRSAR